MPDERIEHWHIHDGELKLFNAQGYELDENEIAIVKEFFASEGGSGGGGGGGGASLALITGATRTGNLEPGQSLFQAGTAMGGAEQTLTVPEGIWKVDAWSYLSGTFDAEVNPSAGFALRYYFPGATILALEHRFKGDTTIERVFSPPFIEAVGALYSTGYLESPWTSGMGVVNRLTGTVKYGPSGGTAYARFPVAGGLDSFTIPEGCFLKLDKIG